MFFLVNKESGCCGRVSKGKLFIRCLMDVAEDMLYFADKVVGIEDFL